MATTSAGDLVLTTSVNTDGLEFGMEYIEKEIQKIDDLSLNVDTQELETVEDIIGKIYKDVEYGSEQWEKLTDNILNNMEGTKEWEAVVIQGIGELVEEYKTIMSYPIIDDIDVQRANELKTQIQEAVTYYKQVTGKNLIVKGFNDIDNSLSGINLKLKGLGNGLEKVGRKVSRIGLSMLGIHSLYGMISSSISRVKEGNEEIATSINAVNNVLDQIIGSLLQALLPFINMLVAGVSIIAETLFGIDVTSNAFSNNMKNANKNTSKLRKQLMGFDEMNILNQNGGTGLLGGNSGGIGDTNGIDKLKDIIEKGKKAIDDFNETMDDINEQPWLRLLDKLFGGGAGTGFFNSGGAGWKLFGIDFRPSSKEGLTEYYSQYFDKVKEIIKNGKTEIDGEYVKFTTEFGDEYMYTTLTWNRLLKDLEEGVATYGSTWYELETEIIPQYQEQMMRGVKTATTKSVKGVINNVKDLRKNYINNWNDIVNEIPALSEAVLNGNYEIKKDFIDIQLRSGDTIRVTKDQFNSFETFLKSKANNILHLFNNNLKETEVNSKGTTNTLQAGIEAVGNKSEETSNSVKVGWLNTGAKIITEFTGNNGVVNSIEKEFDTLPGWLDKNVVQEVVKNFSNLGINIGNKTGNGLREGINKVIDSIEKTYNSQLDLLNKGMSQFGIKSKALSIKLPRLAKGGIINKVGSGVPIGNAIVGERGQEGVVPLTDSQQMEYLGRAIAKYIVINLTNVTELDGRQIARSVSQVMSDMSFASNGGVI